MAKFKPGESGNPKGRPRLSPEQIDLRAKIREAAPGIVERLVELAEAGDVGAMRLSLDKILPNLKPQDEPVSLSLGDTPADSARLVLEAVGRGELTPDQGGQLLGALSAQARIIETSELLSRIERLEQQASGVITGEAA